MMTNWLYDSNRRNSKMKNLIAILFSCLILASCTTSEHEVIFIKTLDQFNTQEENELLAVSLSNYNYYPSLEKRLQLSDKTLDNITWEYFVQVNNNNEISFRLILSNRALKYKDEITEYFTKLVDKQIEHQINDKAIFEDAVTKSFECFEQLDNKEYDNFWNNTSDTFKETTNKDEFLELMQKRVDISKIGGKRTLFYKQYYEKIKGIKLKGFYKVYFIFEENEKMYETITFHKEEKELKIIGYSYQGPY